MVKIVFIGYMGSGKTSVAKIVAEKLQIKLLELDQIIEENEKASITNIFESKGEVYFRKKEHLLFKSFMESSESFVMSTGGGTPCYADNHLFLKGENVVSVYLKASIDELIKRLKEETAQRPLLRQYKDGELKEFVAKHLFDRSHFYHQAHKIIMTDSKTPEDIADEVLRLV